MSRRPSISVNKYPEHLNPFYENDTTYQPIKESNDNKENNESTNKESKHKFWTFGRSRKKRSGSFSIKSTWNELFGKNKTTNAFADRRVTAGSTSHKNELNGRPYSSSRFTHKDQIEFDEAIGTLARRRKYTYDEATRCNSNLTVNGSSTNTSNEPSPDKSTSISDDVTPKPPARRFGQINARPTDSLPTLRYEDNEQDKNSIKRDQIPLPPKRSGLRASQRLPAPQPAERKEVTLNLPDDSSSKDENENLPDDYYMFKRCHQDPVRMSNLSISSCVSFTSTTSAYSRKKRRAPPPPRPKETLETTKENQVHEICETSKVEVKITEPTVIVEEKDSKVNVTETKVNTNTDIETKVSITEEIHEEIVKPDQNDETLKNSKEDSKENISKKKLCDKKTVEQSSEDLTEVKSNETETSKSASLTRSDSFSVKEEIEKIEQQIKELEAKSSYEDKVDPESTRRTSLEETRRTFFKSLVNPEEGKVNVELKELPRVQNECEIIHLNDTTTESKPEDSVKVIELHISEPIKDPEMITKSVMRTKRSSSFTLQKQYSIDFDAKGSKLSL